ncbi:4315_t:CDS:2 [Paraglomus brasilianum]|uniref:ATPase inhibitor, mitochondrial n=1 Tax=Paraglomus brasilianum TaxID=144538 RepID=A0A9N9BLK9_9GLOM|nr:4315_t:CDS:2 [Paraglomus brasilianum]
MYLSRNAVVRKPAIPLPQVNVYPHRSLSIVSARLYPGKSEGAIRESATAFSRKEKAAEDQWARQRDAEKLKHLREALEKHEKSLKDTHEALKDIKENIDNLSEKIKDD